MKNFKNFFEEKLSKKEYIFSHKDKWIIRSSHGKDQFDDSDRKVSKEQKVELFKKSIIWCKKHGKKNKVYVFLMKITKVGMAIEYREDKKHKIEGNHLAIITWFGNIQRLPKPKTLSSFKLKFKSDTKVILENYITSDFEIIEL